MSAVPPISPRSSSSSREGGFGYRPSLDGIRAIAALLVVLFHVGVPFFDHGYTGVDVFFVLSGFLITSLLVRELLDTGRLRFVAFYARRVRRLLPAALLVLFATAAAYEAFATPAAVAENRGGFVAAGLYYANWFFLSRSQDYFAEDAHPSPVQHYWSLSAEEQFYLVWPAVMVGLVVLGRRTNVRLDVMAGVLALAGVVYAGVLALHDPMASYFGTPARAYQLMVGATVALLVLRRERLGRTGSQSARRAPYAAVGLVLLLVAGSPLLGTGSAFWHGVVAAGGTALLLLGIELAAASRVARGLAWSPARTLGLWSYAIYLWHWPVIIVGNEAGVLPDSWLPRVLIVLPLTLLLSAATFKLIERPTQRITLRTPSRQRVVAALGIGLAVAAAFAFPAVLKVDARAQAVLSQATEDPGAAVAVRKTGDAAPSILVVGDSHAHYLYPAFERLARRQGWSLVPSIHNACPWALVEATDNVGQTIPCDEMRRDAVKIATEYNPDLVILISRSIVVRPLRVGDSVIAPGGEGWLDEVKRGTTAFLDEIRPHVGSILIVEPLPETAEPMVDCLSAGGDSAECSAPAISQPGTQELEAYWRSLDGVATVSIDELICPNGTCPAVVDGIPTHRDTNHVTAEFSEHLAPALDRWFRENGITLRSGQVQTG